MIVVDNSALLAIYLDEPEKASFADTITLEDDARIAAPNFLKASMIAETRHGKAGCSDLDELLEALGLGVVAFDADHIEAARGAFRRFGTGRHRAAPNFGDCCAYALARTFGAPLLFKGNDFALTDIRRAL